MKYLILIIPILLIGCSQSVEYNTAKEYLTNMQMPDSYTMTYSYSDSGFAGIDAENFTVSPIITSEKDKYSMSEAKDIAWNFDFGDKIKIEGMACFRHEKWGVGVATMCFKGKEMVIFQYLQTKGNHRQIRQSWMTISPKDACNGNKNCAILMLE